MAQKKKTGPIRQTAKQEPAVPSVGSAAMVAPYTEELPPMLGPALVEKLADLVVERVMAKIAEHPLHGGGQGFESPQLHHPAQTGVLPCPRRRVGASQGASQGALRNPARGLAAQLARYTVDARAQNFSPKTVDKMQLGLKLFDEFLGGADSRGAL